MLFYFLTYDRCGIKLSAVIPTHYYFLAIMQLFMPLNISMGIFTEEDRFLSQFFIKDVVPTFALAGRSSSKSCFVSKHKAQTSNNLVP